MKLIAKIKTTQKPILFFLTNRLPSTKIKKERGQVGVQPSIRLCVSFSGQCLFTNILRSILNDDDA